MAPATDFPADIKSCSGRTDRRTNPGNLKKEIKLIVRRIVSDPSHREGDSSVHSLFAHLTPRDVMAAPFSHVAASGVLEPALYERLEASFPSPSVMCHDDLPDQENVALRMSSKSVMNNPAISEEWQAFFELHTSSLFWRQLVGLFGDAIRATHPRLEEQIGKPLADFTLGMRREGAAADINLECQFVINTPATHRSSVKTPHVDKRQTLFAGMFYMRDAADVAEGGDLQFYRWCHTPRFLPYRMILPGDVEAVSTIPYAANTLVGFLNSPMAVHGVSPRGPAIMPRRYINLVAEVRHHLFRAPFISVPAAVAKWGEISQIRRRKHVA